MRTGNLLQLAILAQTQPPDVVAVRGSRTQGVPIKHVGSWKATQRGSGHTIQRQGLEHSSWCHTASRVRPEGIATAFQAALHMVFRHRLDTLRRVPLAYGVCQSICAC
jgi:hypothetical protein